MLKILQFFPPYYSGKKYFSWFLPPRCIYLVVFISSAMCSSEAFSSILVHFSVSSPVRCKSQYNKSLLTPFLPIQKSMLYFLPSCWTESYASVEMRSLSRPPSLLSLLSRTDRQEKSAVQTFPIYPWGSQTALAQSWKWAVLFLHFLIFVSGWFPGCSVAAENLGADSCAQDLGLTVPALPNIRRCTRQRLAHTGAF